MRIVIVGAGFGGLACAQALGGSGHEVLVIDRHNHNLFQPLLYQVATGALSPADIAEPIRKVLKHHKNIAVILAEVEGVDTAARLVRTADGGAHPYDVLILATGSRYNYFGKEEQWAPFAPGLKTIDNARSIRASLLRSFELAEKTNDEAERKRLLTTVVIGGGPTGVEMAGAIAELGRWTLEGEFRRIDPAQSRVLLVEGSDRILSHFPQKLSDYALGELRRLGVEVMTQTRVTAIEARGVKIGDDFLPTGTVVWGAGVAATPAGTWIGVETDRSGRIPVEGDLSVTGLPDIYALGDIALLKQDGETLPGLAQVAKQQGEYLGRALRDASLENRKFEPFRFHNRGNTAVIGRNAAVFDFGRYQLKGRLAWILWAIVHVYLLVSFEKRALVSLQWLWRYVTKARGVRLIP